MSSAVTTTNYEYQLQTVRELIARMRVSNNIHEASHPQHLDNLEQHVLRECHLDASTPVMRDEACNVIFRTPPPPNQETFIKRCQRVGFGADDFVFAYQWYTQTLTGKVSTTALQSVGDAHAYLLELCRNPTADVSKDILQLIQRALGLDLEFARQKAEQERQILLENAKTQQEAAKIRANQQQEAAKAQARQQQEAAKAQARQQQEEAKARAHQQREVENIRMQQKRTQALFEVRIQAMQIAVKNGEMSHHEVTKIFEEYEQRQQQMEQHLRHCHSPPLSPMHVEPSNFALSPENTHSK